MKSGAKKQPAFNQPASPGESQLTLFSGFPVTIEIFEGPLDLLLHLVRREELDIAEIRVAVITEQYLAYLHTMEELNIQVEAEFLVLAASLMLIKSRWLLPVDPAGADEVAEVSAEAAADPEVELQRRLSEYKIYREAAEMLDESRRERQRIFLRSADESEIGTGFVPLEDVSVFDMIAAVQEMLHRARPDPPARMRRLAVTVPDRIQEILMQLAAERRPILFSELVALPATRLYIIVTFLAILELIRRRRLRVKSTVPMRDFAVELVSGQTDERPAEPLN
jgi:segregation and condensation protein A